MRYRSGMPPSGLIGSLYALLLCFLLMAPAIAADNEMPPQENRAEQQEEEGSDILAGLTPVPGPAVVRLGEQGQITVPEGYLFLNGSDARALLERMRNLTRGDELGLLFPVTFDWMALFVFDASGYVSDQGEDAKIDEEALLSSIRKGVAEANKEKEARGWPSSTVLGWSVKPHYNPETHNLEWGLRFRSEGRENDNYSLRILGREGVMRVTLVAGDEGFQTALADTRRLLRGYSFVEGRTYAEYREGDKLAGYGLAALIAGGTVAAAAKSGILGKLAKPLLIGLAAVGAFVVNLFRRKR